jgi:hypothetical protein
VIVLDHLLQHLGRATNNSSGSGAGFGAFVRPFFFAAEIADDEDHEPAGAGALRLPVHFRRQ